MVKLSGILQNKAVQVNKNKYKVSSWQMILTGLLWLGVSVASADQHVIEALLERARALHLAEEAAWLDLLHYKDHVFGDIYSQVDDNNFFLAESGQQDAEAELLASLRSFFEPQQASTSQCRFPARLHWLDSRLHFAAELPQVACPAFQDWRHKLNVQGITLLFPSMYLNNPASMFGHTFLRLDSQGISPLLSYTLSYAAATDQSDSAVLYVYRGLSGGYPGVFNIQPYYETVRAYGDIEHRDIWEYSLNLSVAEVDQLLRHIWEIRNVTFDYYFIRENCAYRLLSLLDVARPGMQLTRTAHPLYALPADTVRTVATAGLIETATYRPALNSRIQLMYQQLDQPLRNTALSLAADQTAAQSLTDTGLSQRHQAQVLELAHEIRNFTEPDNREAGHDLLLARSRLSLDSQTQTFQFNGARPDQGHVSARWHVGVGKLEQQRFIEFGIRPVFHDLLDPVAGFVEGAAISVLDTRLRWYEHTQQLKLQQLTVFSLMSLSPVTAWSTPLSGQFQADYLRRPWLSTELGVMHFNGALGYSRRWLDSLWYLFASSDLDYADELTDHYALYLGLEAGVLMRFQLSSMAVKLASHDSVSGQSGRKQQLRWQYQINVGQDQSLRFEYEDREDEGDDVRTLSLRYLRYF